MHTEIRFFHDMAGQAGRFAARRSQLQEFMSGTPGVRSFELLETPEGIATIAECEHAEAARACAIRFLGWVRRELPDLADREAFVMGGRVLVRAGSASG